MTPAEYIQLKAFARQDGAVMALLWTASFACYVAGLNSPTAALLALVLALASPFVAGWRVSTYRDECLDGLLSMRRGWAFVVLMFFYASLLFAIAQLLYFSYIDEGRFVTQLSQMLTAPENEPILRSMGMGANLGEALSQLGAMRPIDLVLNILTTNIVIGLVTALPVAAVTHRNRLRRVKP